MLNGDQPGSLLEGSGMDRWVYEWDDSRNFPSGESPPDLRPVEVDDETLRDGIQCPSAQNPPLQAKREFLHLLVRLGVHAVDIGLPASGPRQSEDALYLAKEIARGKLPIEANCAARTVAADIRAIVRISQRAGIPVGVATFIGSSAVRQYAEGWDTAFLLDSTRESVTSAVKEGLPVTFVTEDTTRAHPQILRDLYSVAIDCGATRVCLADTVGYATPAAAKNLVSFIKGVIAASGADVKVDWHGHMDRGLGIASSLAALDAGADRLHGCALGLGERVGNTPLDLLLVNLKLMGRWPGDLAPLTEYVEWVTRWTGVPIPWNYPVFGRDAYRTGTGIHAAAILKALQRGEDGMADVVYSAVPPSWFGKHQIIEVGPMSGESNVVFWLTRHDIRPSKERILAVMHLAKGSNHTLSDDEIFGVLARLDRT
jgi:2-isopropylmalate synthase